MLMTDFEVQFKIRGIFFSTFALFAKLKLFIS